MLKNLVYAVFLIITLGQFSSFRNKYIFLSPTVSYTASDRRVYEETGIKVNVAYLRKGMIEKMKAEGNVAQLTLF